MSCLSVDDQEELGEGNLGVSFFDTISLGTLQEKGVLRDDIQFS